MNPTQVIDCQADLLARLDDRRFAEVLSMTVARRGDYDPGGEIKGSVPDLVVGALRNHVRAAYAYRVHPEMSALVEETAARLPDDLPFDRFAAPSDCGIVRFDKPLPLTDVRGKTMLVSWATWGPAQVKEGPTGSLLSVWNDALTDPDVIAYGINTEILGDEGREAGEIVRHMLGRWHLIGADVQAQGRPVGTPTWEPTPAEADLVRADGDTPTPATNVVRYLVALWSLLGQTLTDATDGDVDRPARRRAGKAGIPGRVTVIQLRRTENAHRGDGQSPVDWSHRWTVRRHPRRQRYGPGRTLVKTIWIEEHVKGPEGAPLIVTDKVYDLSR